MTDDIHDRLDKLESLVEHQQEAITDQQDRIEDQEETIEKQRERIAELNGETTSDCETDQYSPISRRSALKVSGLVGLLGLGASNASANAQGQVGTSTDPLNALYTEELNGGVTGDTALTDLTGTGLSISSGSLNASGASDWEDADSDDLLEPKGTKTGIDVMDVQTDSLNGGVTGDTALTSLSGTGLEIGSGSLGITSGSVGTTELATDFMDLSTLFGSPVATGANLDLGGNNINNAASINNGGSAISVDDSINLSNSDSIQDNSTDAIQFDGSQNVTVPNGYLSVSGHSDVDNVGVLAYLSSNQTITADTRSTLSFDATDVDHFGGFDTNTGKYTVQQAGDYHVDFFIDWADSFSEGDPIDYYLNINGAFDTQFNTIVATNTNPTRHFSKTLFGLSADDTIDVEVYHDAGPMTDKEVTGQTEGLSTYLTIHKVG